MRDSPEPATTAASSASRRLPAVEYARGAASLAVLLFHSLHAIPAQSLHPILRPILPVTELGWLGVNVFFTVSGWCIAERLAAAHRRSENPAAFLSERALRIFPSYWAALAITVLLLALASPFNGIPLARNVPATLAAWLVELSLTQPAFARTGVLIVSWTLFHELTFYAAGACALVLRQRGVPATALLVLGGVGCLLVTALHPSGPFSGFAFWTHFFAGVLAWWSFNRPIGATWLTALLGTLVALAFECSAAALVAAATALALAVAARHPPPLPSLFAIPLTALGAASYSLYLIHVAVISPFFNLAARAVPPSSALLIAVWLTGLGLAVAAGLAFHHGIERPCERWRHRLVARPAAA